MPVPPPSLKLEPVQRVDIEGELGVSNPQSGTRVFVYDAYGVGVPGAFVFAEPDGSFRFEGFEINLTMNCLKVRSEEPGAYGVMSVPSFFTASIDADDRSGHHHAVLQRLWLRWSSLNANARRKPALLVDRSRAAYFFLSFLSSERLALGGK